MVGSNPTQDMVICVCVYSVFVLFCVQVAALRRAYLSSKESYHLSKKNYETEDEARAQRRAVEPLMNEWTYFRLLNDSFTVAFVLCCIVSDT
jgi:hypothetical protein